MAQLFKGHVVDDGSYPMPPDPNRQVIPASPPGLPAHASVDAAEIQKAAAELEQLVRMVSAMRPKVQSMADMLHDGAQQQGYSDGLQRAQAEVQEHLMAAIAALTEAQQQRHEIADQNEAALADLALRIARKVIGEHLEADPAIVARIVQTTIAELEPTTSLAVHVHPADVELVEAHRPELERLVKGSGRVTVVADGSVDRGGCILVSPVGEVDARIQTKLSVLETAFVAQRRQLLKDGTS